MARTGSVTHFLNLLRHGQGDAVRFIWERYFPRLVEHARLTLGPDVRRAADEEDVALSALERFCRAAQEGRYPDLADRHELWRLLLRITTRKALDLARREQRQRRGGGTEGEAGRAGAGEFTSLSSVAGDEPSPAFAAEMAETCRCLLERLPDDDLRTLAVTKLEGLANREIADLLGCSVRTVERRLHLIRDLWRAEESQSCAQPSTRSPLPTD
jgi:RNA polymerase sigma factor (sigma-70 family)